LVSTGNPRRKVRLTEVPVDDETLESVNTSLKLEGSSGAIIFPAAKFSEE
jgi:hypothetical protein